MSGACEGVRLQSRVYCHSTHVTLALIRRRSHPTSLYDVLISCGMCAALPSEQLGRGGFGYRKSGGLHHAYLSPGICR